MDPSVGEKTTIVNNLDNSSSMTQIIFDKVKSVISFFSMTKEEMLQANIDLRGCDVGHNQNEIENLSYSPSISQDDERIL